MKATTLLGSVVVGMILYGYYTASQDATYLYASCLIPLVVGVVFFWGAIRPKDGVINTILSKPTQKQIDELHKTGYEPEEIEKERQAHNENARAIAWWHGNASYIDYDGYKRNLTTNELEYMNSRNKGNGRR